MAKSVQQPRKHNLPVENKNEIVQAEIDHILSSDFFIETERDEDLHSWLDRRRKSKQCGLLLEDKGSNLSQSCYEYSCSLASQKGSLLSIPLKVLYVKTSSPGGASDVHTDILNALKRPLNTGSLRDLRKRVRGTLKSYQVQLLIVDDAHLLKRKAMVELTKLYEDLRLPVVMSGAYDLEDRLSKSRGYEHISNVFLAVHNYRTLTIDEVASVVAAWEEEVLELWEEKPNWAENEEIIELLYVRSYGLIQPLFKFIEQIAVAQLQHSFNPDSEEGIDLEEVLGITRTARVTL